MHSSRMRTGHSLTVCQSLLPGGCVCSGGCLLLGDVCSLGVSAPRGSAPGGCLLWGVSALGGVCSGGCLLWGVSAPGGSAWRGLLRGSAPGGCLLWGCLLWGVSAPGGSAWGGLLRGSAPGGCLLWGVSAPRGWCGIPACTEADTPCEQNDKQVQKYYLGHNFVAAGKKIEMRKCQLLLTVSPVCMTFQELSSHALKEYFFLRWHLFQEFHTYNDRTFSYLISVSCSLGVGSY